MANHIVNKQPITSIQANDWKDISNAYDSDLNSFAYCKSYDDAYFQFDFNLPSDATVNSLTLNYRARTDSGSANIQPRFSNKNKSQGSAYKNIRTSTTLSDYSWNEDLDKIVADSKLGFNSKVELINGLVYRLRWTTSSKTIYLYNIYVTADYTLPEYRINIIASSEGGAVSGGGTYESGTSATIKATPNSGYKFVRWSDGNTNATRTITVTGNITLTADFAVDKFNAIYIGARQPKSIYLGINQIISIHQGMKDIYY